MQVNVGYAFRPGVGIANHVARDVGPVPLSAIGRKFAANTRYPTANFKDSVVGADLQYFTQKARGYRPIGASRFFALRVADKMRGVRRSRAEAIPYLLVILR